VIQAKGGNAEAVAVVLAEATRRYVDDLPDLARLAGIQLEAWDVPKYVSDPLLVPGGPVITADCHDMPVEAVLLWPETLERALDAAGLEDVILTTPGRHEEVYSVVIAPNCVVLYAFQPPEMTLQRSFPAEFVRAMCDWVTTSARPEDRVWVALDASVEIPTTAHDVAALVAALTGSGSPLVTHMGADDIVRWGRREFNGVLVLAAAGVGLDSNMTRVATEMETIAVTLARLSPHVMVDLKSRYIVDWAMDPRARDPDDAANMDAMALLCDQVVDDAYPFQILTSAHLALVPSLRDRAEAVGDDRYCLRFGSYEAWLPDSPDLARTLADARAQLAPAMITPSDAYERSQRRASQGSRRRETER
jgi:hypothetical protein